MEKKAIIWFMFLSILIGVVTYLSLDNVIYAAAVFLIYSLYFILIGTKLISKYIKRVNKNKECYAFINNYIISLSSKNSYSEAFISATIGAKGELEKEIEHIKELTPIEKIKYLADYFNQNTYQMFLNIIDSYVENGGDILDMSKLLLMELTKIESNQIEFERKGKSKVFEFGVLWAITLVILVIIRFALNQFYQLMLESLLYQIGLLGFFLFALISFHLIIKGYTNEKISFKKGQA